MEQQEKLAVRARLVASGILRYHTFNLLSVEELNQSVEILAEELVSLRDRNVALKIRGDVERYGLKFPELGSTPGDSQVDRETAAEFDDVNSSQAEETKRMPFQYVRRANNQVSEQLETCIGELLGRGWKKSAVARALRVNRRVVIRVAREAQSAHKCPIAGG
jgi:hypothetical protein